MGFRLEILKKRTKLFWLKISGNVIKLQWVGWIVGLLLGWVGVHRSFPALLGDLPPYFGPFQNHCPPRPPGPIPQERLGSLLPSRGLAFVEHETQARHLSKPSPYLIFLKSLGGLFFNYCRFQMEKRRHRIMKSLVEATQVVNIPGWDLNPGLPETGAVCLNAVSCFALLRWHKCSPEVPACRRHNHN